MLELESGSAEGSSVLGYCAGSELDRHPVVPTAPIYGGGGGLPLSASPAWSPVDMMASLR